MEIAARNVSLSLSGKQIVKDASLRVLDGQMVGLFGPNGSGKSTLLKSIYRVLKPSTGEILFDGTPLDQIPYRESAKRLAVVSQFTTLNFDFTVTEMVLMGRSPHKGTFDRDTPEDFAIVRRCLETVEMAGFGDRKYSTLSGGEKQRVLLARALAQDTQVLVLDEPTNHLDIRYQLQTMEVIRSLNKGVLLALHDLNMAFRYCDYIYVMKNGSVAAEGKPANVITAELIREVYEVESRIYENPVTNLPCIAFLSARQ